MKYFTPQDRRNAVSTQDALRNISILIPNLLVTGGPSQVLKQASKGAVITVELLAAEDLSNGVTGTGAVVLARAPIFLAGLTVPSIVLTGTSPITALGQLAMGSNSEIGTGSTGVTVTTTGAGGSPPTGPTAPQTIKGYLQWNLDGATVWVPFME